MAAGYLCRECQTRTVTRLGRVCLTCLRRQEVIPRPPLYHQPSPDTAPPDLLQAVAGDAPLSDYDQRRARFYGLTATDQEKG